MSDTYEYKVFVLYGVVVYVLYIIYCIYSYIYIYDIYIYICVCVCVSLTHLFKDPPALNPPQESSLSSSTDSCFTDGLPSMENQLGHPHDRSGRHKHWRPCRPPVEAKSLWSPWRPPVAVQEKRVGTTRFGGGKDCWSRGWWNFWRSSWAWSKPFWSENSPPASPSLSGPFPLLHLLR